MAEPIIIKFYSPVNEGSTGRLLKAVDDMLDRTTLHPEAALEWGLAHEIRQQLFEDGGEVISIQAGG